MDLLRSSISLRQLHYLVAVADAGSFSAAADQTHVAQPALSRQIATLEARVGLRLLNRSRTGVALTDGGARLYALARNTLERLGSVQAELRTSEQMPAGPVTVALSISLASMLVPTLVRELEARYPDIVLRIDDRLSPENQHSLEAGLVDFGVVPAADELVNVDYEPLVRESLLLVERPRASRRAPPTITLAQVAKRRLVLPPRSFHIRRIIDDVARVAHCTLDVAYEQRSVSTIMSLVRAGLAGTITNSPSIYQFWTDEIVARRVVQPEIIRTVSLAWPRRRPLSVAARAAYDIVKRSAIDAVKEGRWHGEPLG